MKYIRQLLFECKSREELENLYSRIQDLSQIDYVRKFVVMRCVNQNKYEYIENKYDCSVLLYFSRLSDIEKYCMHPLHVDFVKTMLQRVNITVFDYSLDE